MLYKESSDIISFQNIVLTFTEGTTVFHDLNLKIPAGSFHFLTGPSGAGKSTLLKLIYLGLVQTRGTLKLFGLDTKTMGARDIPHVRRKIGMVFQDFRLIPHLSAMDNVAIPLRVRGVDMRRAQQEAAELLNWVGLGDALHQLPYALSGGQQQRIAIARAVVGRPQVLLADEPTGNVDDKLAVKLLYLFEEMNKSGTTVIVATHNRTLAQEFKYPEIFLKSGRATFMNKKESKHALS